MSCSSFPDPYRTAFVADTSVLINLEASGHAGTIIQATTGVLLTTKNAFDEVLAGELQGYSTAVELRDLCNSGALEIVELGGAEEAVYRSLVEGPAAQTLGDGEAATLAYAVENDAVALIDERKAQRICRERFGGTQVTTTTDLILHSNVVAELGDEQHVAAVHAALTKARMHVPRHRVAEVVKLLGVERSVDCPSLPQNAIGQSAL
ncbi:hypothetical protein [Cognatishimia activa]|uniref:PIN domain-containing protein n=1 Tax=Cognatishimia activa TaxID=1715691 RepID=A0A975ENA0_9RHOB|nr:hypothetical protein [Cognatishimia activa]QTN34837.1 hypothetical protein HZ995_10010 [Cognatishimia activa]